MYTTAIQASVDSDRVWETAKFTVVPSSDESISTGYNSNFSFPAIDSNST
jgi:hypothetical protein